MGISADNARLLLEVRKRGLAFGRTLMIGRQNVYLSAQELAGLVRSMGIPEDGAFASAVRQSGDYAEPFFRALGADAVESLDASDFEGANLIHDLNRPVPTEWHERYDVVYDGGTLEHVFDFPTAIANCLRLVRPGGTLILHTPANNALGHGLYQFSPELFFRVLDAPNGFALERMIAVESGVRTRWHEVIDPRRAGVRGQVANRVPVWLHVEARRIGPVPERLQDVQQSDYQTRWEAHQERGETVTHLADTHHRVDARLRRLLLGNLPRLTRVLERLVGVYFTRAHTFRNPATFRPFRWGK